MQYDEFLGQIRHRSGLGSLAEAERATSATLEKQAERLAGGEARDLSAQLPPELAHFLQPREPGIGTKLTLQEFFEAVRLREGVDLQEATLHARVIIGVLTEAVCEARVTRRSCPAHGCVRSALSRRT